MCWHELLMRMMTMWYRPKGNKPEDPCQEVVYVPPETENTVCACYGGVDVCPLSVCPECGHRAVAWGSCSECDWERTDGRQD
jgi:hypothetical protein